MSYRIKWALILDAEGEPKLFQDSMLLTDDRLPNPLVKVAIDLIVEQVRRTLEHELL